MFESINEYIQRDKEKRQSHLDLEEQCYELGTNSKECRGLLAYYLGTTVPRGLKIVLCHACNNNACSNPKHLYWGTAKENRMDSNDKTNERVRKALKEKYGENWKDIVGRKAYRVNKERHERMRNPSKCTTEDINEIRRKLSKSKPEKPGWKRRFSKNLGQVPFESIDQLVETFCSDFYLYPDNRDCEMVREALLECSPKEKGWIKRLSKKLGVSHTHARRLSNRYCSDIEKWERKRPVKKK